MDTTLGTRNVETKKAFCHPGILLLFIYCIAIIRDLNGFDLFFLVAEVKCHKPDEIFSRVDLYYAADTLHDVKRVSGIHLCNM